MSSVRAPASTPLEITRDIVHRRAASLSLRRRSRHAWSRAWSRVISARGMLVIYLLFLLSKVVSFGITMLMLSLGWGVEQAPLANAFLGVNRFDALVTYSVAICGLVGGVMLAVAWGDRVLARRGEVTTPQLRTIIVAPVLVAVLAPALVDALWDSSQLALALHYLVLR